MGYMFKPIAGSTKFIGFIIFGLTALAFFTSPTLSAQEREFFCERYARNAVVQYQAAQSLDCPNLSFPPWSGNEDDHLEWCEGVSREEAIANTLIREQHFRACHGGPPDISPTFVKEECEKYANRTLSQQHDNLFRKCGFSDQVKCSDWEWSVYYRNHFDQCVADFDQRDRYMKDRQVCLDERCPTSEGDLEAFDWCYRIDVPLGMGQTITITFYPLIRNVGPLDFFSEHEGKYTIGVKQGPTSEQTHPQTIRASPYWFTESQQILRLDRGVTVPYSSDCDPKAEEPNCNVYTNVGNWGFTHQSDLNSSNNDLATGSNYTVYDDAFAAGGYLANKECQE